MELGPRCKWLSHVRRFANNAGLFTTTWDIERATRSKIQGPFSTRIASVMTTMGSAVVPRNLCCRASMSEKIADSAWMLFWLVQKDSAMLKMDSLVWSFPRWRAALKVRYSPLGISTLTPASTTGPLEVKSSDPQVY